MSTHRLKTLLTFKRQLEDAAAQTLSRATAARVRAETEQAALGAAVVRAREALMTHRDAAPADVAQAPERAADAAGRGRFEARLAAAMKDGLERQEKHRRSVCQPAQDAENQARQDHLAARQEREAIETHWQRQRAAEQKLAERKQEAEQDDRGSRDGTATGGDE